MATSLDKHTLGLVFQSRPDIFSGIQKAADTPARVSLFNDIASFVHSRLTAASEPALKRRRVDEGGDDDVKSNGVKTEVSHPQTLTLNPGDATWERALLEIKEISVSIPQRKKYDLCFTDGHIYARAPGSDQPVPGMIYAWKDIEHVFYLPVPEKTQVQHNYLLLPTGSCPPTTSNKTEPMPPDPLVFTIPAAAPKPGTVSGAESVAAAAVSDNYSSLLHWAITTRLRAAGSNTGIVAADPARFHSVVRQPQRPSEKAVHVKAFRGSKEGYLFFLPTGILWGFRKPLLFISLDRVAAVSYTSVLQRTFNMVVEVFVSAGGETTEEIEFAMIDQEDYQGIDETYVRRHRLQDRSMAEQRRAKLELAENKPGGKRGDATTDDDTTAVQEGGAVASGLVGADGMTELERAQMEAEKALQDAEDEEEEDYNPGSEGESDGSGESSEEEDEEDDEDAEAGEDGEDLEADDEDMGGGT